MQLLARDQFGEIILASLAKKKIDYVCMECGRLVHLRGGPYRQSHFYHLDPTPSCRQHQKGLKHLQVQLFFLEILPKQSCDLEHRFSEIHRIADVAWMSEKIVFEIQYSPISAEEVLARNKDYQSIGWQVVWILHDDRYNKTRVTEAERVLEAHPHYFTNMNERQVGIIYDQFEWRGQGLRERCRLETPIDVASLFRTTQNHQPIKFLQKRETWPLYFENDLMDLSRRDPLPDLIQEALLLHEKFSKLNQHDRSLLAKFFERAIKKPYRIIFRMVLERFCQ